MFSSFSSVGVVDMAAATDTTTSSTTSRTSSKKKAPENNVTQKPLTEFQSVIAYACYNSPFIAGRGESMTE